MSIETAIYLISYKYTGDVKGEKYRALLEAITSRGGWDFIDEICSTQIVESTLTASELYEELVDYFTEPNDKLLVAEIIRPAWYNLNPVETAKRRRLGLESRHPKATDLPAGD